MSLRIDWSPNYLKSNNLLFENQFGFIPRRETDQAIAKQQILFYNTLVEGIKCAAIYLDLAKAFDTILTTTFLFHKMKNIGITGSALALFLLPE